MRLICACVFLVLSASVASAQPITKYQLAIYNAGAAAPLSAPVDLLVANIQCAQVKPAGSTINPSKVSWDDPADTSKACIWTDPGSGPIRSVPFGGSYEATIRAGNIAGLSAESNRAPFSRPGAVPDAPTGLKAGS